LPSGLKLALLPKKTRGNNVVAHLTLRLGDEKSLTNRRSAGLLTASMLDRGTIKRTRQQLKDEYDRHKARVSFSPGSISPGSPSIPIATEAYVSIQTTRENFPAVMRLVAEVLREPAFPQAEFDQLKQEELTELEQQRNDPIMLTINASVRHVLPYPKGHPRYLPTFDEAIAELTRQAASR
jgi:zinc protease